MTTTRRYPSPSTLLIPLVLAAFVTAGCQTTVGNYFANRGRDLGECFRVQVGGGLGIGASVRAAGLLDLGLCVAAYNRKTGVGWVYGNGYAFGYGTPEDSWDAEVDYSPLWLATVVAIPLYLPIVAVLSMSGKGVIGSGWSNQTQSITAEQQSFLINAPHWQIEEGPPLTLGRSHADHECWMFLPPLAGRDREARLNPLVHAFDIEASVYAGIVYARAGFSPGEFVDFLLGWFGVDIAGDDWRVDEVERTVEDT